MCASKLRSGNFCTQDVVEQATVTTAILDYAPLLGNNRKVPSESVKESASGTKIRNDRSIGVKRLRLHTSKKRLDNEASS